MAQIELAVPVLVRPVKIDNNQEYKISPLFFSHPTVNHRRYDQATARFIRDVRQHFKSLELSRANHTELFWYMFNPRIHHKIVRMEFQAGKQFVKGDFTITHFELQGKTFVCLPGFSSYIFLATDSNPHSIYAQARNVIDKLLREYKKQDNESTWDITPHVATKGEFVSTIDFTLPIHEGKFSFEKSAANDFFFAFFGGLNEFDGAEELEKVGTNLNEMPLSDLKRSFYRDELVEQLQEVIYQSENTPLVLLGSEGVGKHSVVHEIVARYRQSMTEKETAAELWTRIWHLDPTRIIAGMSIVGMWQRRLETILRHVRQRLRETYAARQLGTTDRTDKILIDNAVALLRIGKSAQNSMTLSDVLKPYLEKRMLQVILIATPEEWKIVQEKDRRFADLFQVVRIQEPSYETAVSMVLQQRKVLENNNNCTITVSAVRQLFNIHRNYFKRKALPGSVAKLLTQLAVKYSHQTIDTTEVQAEFKDYSGLRLEIFDDNYTLEEEELEKHISSQLIGQPQAVGVLANVIHNIKAKLTNPNKPLGSFLFIGPTGVGKTEAAKIVCEYLLGSAQKLMRFDMNEYIDEWAISRLIGDYYNPEGQLTGKIRYNPFGVLLFDEIEKAHPKVHDLLLQVLDDGRLTDSIGRTVDFSNTIIIMTSNIGAQQVAQQLGYQTETRNDAAIYNKAVESFFRPEFINRIDKIVIFNNLELEHILGIAKLQINNLLSRDGFVRRTTILNISPDALDWVARRGFNARMGGRALKRQIERDLTVFTAEQLVKTSIDQPVIFDICIENGQLRPNIELLQFVKPLPEGWLPNLPREQDLKQAYGNLLLDVERLERFVLATPDDDAEDNWEDDEWDDELDDDELDFADDFEADDDRPAFVSTQDKWHFYAFTNQLAEKKEKLRRMLMGFRSSYVDNISPTVFRLKGSGTSNIIYNNHNNKRDVNRILMEDRLFQQSALEEISYVYQHAPEQFDKAQGLFLDDYLDMRMFQVFAPFAKHNHTQRATLHIRSMISNAGKEEAEFLLQMYALVLGELEISAKLDSEAQTLELEGYGINLLLAGEEGYHFFYRARQNPLPMRVWLTSDEPIKRSHDKPFVVRLYDVWLGKNHKSSTITDLRTGFTNQANIFAQEFKVFLVAGMHATNA